MKGIWRAIAFSLDPSLVGKQSFCKALHHQSLQNLQRFMLDGVLFAFYLDFPAKSQWQRFWQQF